MSILPSNQNDRESYILGLQIAGDFGIVIAAPIILFVWVGQQLDHIYHTAPWATVSAFVIAATLSGAIVYRKAKYYASRYQELTTKKKK